METYYGRSAQEVVVPAYKESTTYYYYTKVKSEN